MWVVCKFLRSREWALWYSVRLSTDRQRIEVWMRWPGLQWLPAISQGLNLDDWLNLSQPVFLSKTCLPTDTCSAWQPWSKCQCPPCACAESCYRWVGDTGESRKAAWGGAERCFAHAQWPRVELCRYFWNVWRENCRRSRCWSSPNMVPTVILPW
jgi:hypothetical protein